MGLKETIQSAVNKGFGSLSTMRETVILKSSNDNPTYSPTAQTISFDEDDVEVVGLFARYNIREIDGQVVKRFDQKFIAPQANFGGVSPQSIDRLIRADGTEWSIINVSKDPADAVWVLQVRQAAG